MNEDEQFFAWLDGELQGEEKERVSARVAASPELTARAEQHRRLAGKLRDAFDPAMADRAPPTFGNIEMVDFGAKADGGGRRPSWLAAPQWFPIAASLALGLVAGFQFAGRGAPVSPVAIEDGRLVAAAGLEEALYARLASAPASDGARIGLTFRNGAGEICRSFTDGSASGLACREGGDWRIRGLFQAGEGQSGDYRMAAGEDSRLAALIDETIRGEPFDAAQEKAAQERDWR